MDVVWRAGRNLEPSWSSVFVDGGYCFPPLEAVLCLASRSTASGPYALSLRTTSIAPSKKHSQSFRPGAPELVSCRLQYQTPHNTCDTNRDLTISNLPIGPYVCPSSRSYPEGKHLQTRQNGRLKFWALCRLTEWSLPRAYNMKGEWFSCSCFVRNYVQVAPA